MTSFDTLHKDGWGDNSNHTYYNTHFTLANVDLGLLQKSSFEGNTKELLFGDENTYKYRVQQNKYGVLTIIDMTKNLVGELIAVDITDELFNQIHRHKN